eukprot:4753154-Amphidinium_carterae.1
MSILEGQSQAADIMERRVSADDCGGKTPSRRLQRFEAVLSMHLGMHRAWQHWNMTANLEVACLKLTTVFSRSRRGALSANHISINK